MKYTYILPTYSFSTLMLGMRTALSTLQVMGGGAHLAHRCQKYLKKLVDFSLAQRQIQESVQQRQQQLTAEGGHWTPPGAISTGSANIGVPHQQLNPHPVESPRSIEQNRVSPLDVADTSSLDIDLGPFFMGEDLDPFLPTF
jgi:hypothetical protein